MFLLISFNVQYVVKYLNSLFRLVVYTHFVGSALLSGLDKRKSAHYAKNK